jgi:putative transposase
VRSRYKIINEGQLYFITSTIIQWIPVFNDEKYFDIIIESLQFCRKEKGLRIYAYVILDNHFHLIVSSEKLELTIQSFKRHTARKILEKIKNDKKDWLLNQLEYFKLKHKTKSVHQVWQEGYHPQEIISHNMFEQKVNYMHFNPVRRGYVNEPVHWKYSSASTFANESKGLLELDELI